SWPGSWPSVFSTVEWQGALPAGLPPHGRQRTRRRDCRSRTDDDEVTVGATTRQGLWDGLFERLEVARNLHARAKWSSAEADFRGLLADLETEDADELGPEERQQWTELVVRSYLGLSNPVYALYGSLDRALALCDQAAEIERASPDPRMASLVHVQRGVLHSRAGQPLRALGDLTRALREPGLVDHRDLAT